MTELKIPNSFERHAQTSLVLLLVALLLWVGSTTQQTAVSIAEMRIEIAYMKAVTSKPPQTYFELSKRIDDLNARVKHVEDIYTKPQN